VRFEVEAPGHVVALDCNCSLCAMTGFLHLIVPASKFRLVQGEDHLATYTFGTGVAKHRFCKTCGVKSFYIPRSNPDGFDVNVRCFDKAPPELVIEPFDGRDWDANGPALAGLSKN
jgi:hypothetical protein